MATVQNKKGRFSKTGVVSRAKKIGERKTNVAKDKPLIHTAEENKDEPHYHNVSGEQLFEGSRIIDLLFVFKQLKDGCAVCGELQNIGKVCTISFERPVNYLCDAWHVSPPKYEAWTHFNRP